MKRRQHCTYFEFARGGPQKLRNLGSEIRGRWNTYAPRRNNETNVVAALSRRWSSPWGRKPPRVFSSATVSRNDFVTEVRLLLWVDMSLGAGIFFLRFGGRPGWSACFVSRAGWRPYRNATLTGSVSRASASRSPRGPVLSHSSAAAKGNSSSE